MPRLKIMHIQNRHHKQDPLILQPQLDRHAGHGALGNAHSQARSHKTNALALPMQLDVNRFLVISAAN